jgi:Trk K+ transport system NAD-binding subunit
MAAKKPAAKPAKKPSKPAPKKAAPKKAKASIVSTAPTAASALALVTKLGLTEAEVQAAVAAKDVSAAVLGQLAKVNVSSIAAAFPDEVVQALLAPGSSIKVKAPQLAKLAAAAARAQTAATVSSKLSQGASVIEHEARTDADVLDAIVHDIQPQVVAQAAIDEAVGEAFKPVLAYWTDRYPGGKKAAAPKPPKP